MRTVASLPLVMTFLGQSLPNKLTPEQQALVDEFTVPFPPFHFVGNVYYVGTKELSSFLFVTPAGNILLDSGMEQTVPLIRASIEKLGFRFQDTKILINSHAHFDHAGGNRAVRDTTGAQVMVMAEDAEEVQHGHPEFVLGWRACPIDRVLKDGDTVVLGGITLTAHLTPGHTKGCTTWTTRVSENGKSHDLVLLGGFTINQGIKLLGTPDYPNMAGDFARTFRVLKALPCDVFGAQHPYFFDMEAKVARLNRRGANPFVDPAGYRAAVTEAEAAYLKQLATERARR